MRDEEKTREQLMAELSTLRKRTAQWDAEQAARKWAEEALRRSEEKYRGLFEEALDMIHIVNADGIIIDANRAELTALGYAYDELVGKPLLEIIHPDHREITRERLGILRSGRSIGRYETALITRTGKKVLVEGSVVPEMVDGQFVFTRAILRDITERKRAEEALRRSLKETERGQHMLLALSRAAQAVQRAHTPEEVCQTVLNEVAKLGYHATIVHLTEDRTHLIMSHMTFGSSVLRAAEQLTGISARGYRFPLVPGGFYERVLYGGKAVLSDPGADPIVEALPRRVRPLAGWLPYWASGKPSTRHSPHY